MMCLHLELLTAS
uniref:Uncharacterized protein n=1 Tax=Anguilla anguilla TaxID=7936 RepID=A0A0E9PF25_ANGAN